MDLIGRIVRISLRRVPFARALRSQADRPSRIGSVRGLVIAAFGDGRLLVLLALSRRLRLRQGGGCGEQRRRGVAVWRTEWSPAGGVGELRRVARWRGYSELALTGFEGM